MKISAENIVFQEILKNCLPLKLVNKPYSDYKKIANKQLILWTKSERLRDAVMNFYNVHCTTNS